MGVALNGAARGGQKVSLNGRDAGKECIPSVAINLSQPQNADAVWRLKVCVQLEGGGIVELGTFRCKPTNFANAKTARVVALCNCPGAFAWHVFADLVSGTPRRGEVLDLCAIDCCADAKPIRVLETSFFETLGGVSGVVNIPDGQVVTGVTAFTDPGVATGTIQVAAYPACPIPDGGQLELRPPYDLEAHSGALVGPIAITFSNTRGYTIELLN